MMVIKDDGNQALHYEKALKKGKTKVTVKAGSKKAQITVTVK